MPHTPHTDHPRHADVQPGDRLGPWVLRRLLGRGAMGAVYQALEPETGTWAAVKVLAPSHHATRDQAAESLARELDAVRRLAHPHIVRLLGHGRVPGPDPAGSVWIAMELIHDAKRPAPRDWAETLEVARAVLGALAHAHAHRVLHLDLKPDNVLVQAHPDGARIRLGDFGMAATSGGDGLVRVRGGTIAYMPPEQIRLDGRAVGPASDLYALGCLVTALVTGGPPFKGASARIRNAHLHRTPALLEPLFDVPAGLQAWVDRLLEKAPEDRFPSAAHAAAALEALGPPEAGSGSDGEATESSTTTFVFGADTPSVSLPAPSSAAPTAALPCPEAPPGTPAPSALTGLISDEEGPPPPADDPALRAVWSLVARLVEPRVTTAALTGPIGVGALAVARTAARLAVEHGLADHLELYPDLARTLRRWTRSTGLQGDRLHRHLGPLPGIARALETGDGLVEAAVTAVRHRASRLPVVLVAPSGTLTTALASALSRLEAPVLVLARHPDGPTPPWAEVSVRVGPVPGAVEERLRSWVRLEPEVAAQVERRAAGCPRLAVALLDQARRQGVLRGEQSLALAPGAWCLPAVAWPEAERHIDGLAPPGDAVRRALELAALAEEPPGGPIWEAARSDLGLPDPGERFDALRQPDGAWRPALRECLRARAEGAEHLHRALALHAGADARGRHLMHAGEPQAAAPWLLEAAERAAEEGDEAEAHALLAAHDAAARAAAVPPRDAAAAKVLRAKCYARRGLHAERVIALTGEVVGADPALDAMALALRAHALSVLGRNDEALAAVDEALSASAIERDARRAALRVRFIVQRRRDELDAAAVTLASLGGLAVTDRATGEWHYSAGLLDAERGRFEDAAAHLVAAAPLLRADGLHAMAATALVSSATLLRAVGRLDEAARHLDRSRDAGDPDVLRPLRYAQLAVQSGDLDPLRAARDQLHAQPELSVPQRRLLRILELPIAAVEPDPERWQAALDHARHCLDHRLERGELPWALEQSARLAARHGHPDRARPAAELAARAWRNLRREADARRAEATWDASIRPPGPCDG